MTKRHFSPYELNHLRRWAHQIDPTSIGDQPVEYVTGHAEFLGLDFLVTPDVLIPRLESEQIVTDALDFIDNHNLSHPVIADIGTGSGCLGLSLAVKLSRRQIPYTIYLSDLSLKALKVADLNAQRLLKSPANLFFQESNLLKSYPPIKFDLILANLPYIPTPNLAALEPSVREYEPHLALDGGIKGNLFINALLDDLPHFLNQEGMAIFEIDDTHSLTSFTIPDTLVAKIELDCFQKPRFLLVTYSNS